MNIAKVCLRLHYYYIFHLNDSKLMSKSGSKLWIIKSKLKRKLLENSVVKFKICPVGIIITIDKNHNMSCQMAILLLYYINNFFFIFWNLEQTTN